MGSVPSQRDADGADRRHKSKVAVPHLPDFHSTFTTTFPICLHFLSYYALPPPQVIYKLYTPSPHPERTPHELYLVNRLLQRE